MKTTIRTEHDKQFFIQAIQDTEVLCAYRAEFSKIRRKRSLESNSYLWLLHTIEQEETGTDKDDIYLWCLNKFPTFKEIEVHDEVRLIQISSSAFDSKQMSTHIDNVRREMSMNGIPSPDANSEKAIDAFNYYRDNGKL